MTMEIPTQPREAYVEILIAMIPTQMLTQEKQSYVTVWIITA